jgi:HEAT repeat protein
MERRDLVLLSLGAAAALAAAGLAVGWGRGTVDSDVAKPAADGNGGQAPTPARRRGLPAPVLPPDLPAPAREAIRREWPRVESGTDAEAAAALAALTPVAAGSPLLPCAPAVLEALAPGLAGLIQGKDPALATAAMRCAAVLARAGGVEGRKALARTGLVGRDFALQAYAGSAGLQVETAALLGFAGGPEAVDSLVRLVTKSPSAEVRAAGVEGLGEAFGADRKLSREAILAVMEAAAPGSPAAVRSACMRTFARAWEAIRPYEVGPRVAAALADADPAVRIAAARFLVDHPLQALSGDLVRALDDPDPGIVELVADALAVLRPPGAAEALEKRRADLKDPAARKAVERALRALGPPR